MLCPCRDKEPACVGERYFLFGGPTAEYFGVGPQLVQFSPHFFREFCPSFATDAASIGVLGTVLHRLYHSGTRLDRWIVQTFVTDCQIGWHPGQSHCRSADRIVDLLPAAHPTASCVDRRTGVWVAVVRRTPAAPETKSFLACSLLVQ
jgi:hypothetical protein